jgi:hypothetical protein
MLLGQLAAVEVEDLPGLVKFLLGSATKANAEQASTHMPVVRLYISLAAMQAFGRQLRWWRLRVCLYVETALSADVTCNV